MQATAITESVAFRPTYDPRQERLRRLQLGPDAQQRRDRYEEDDDEEEGRVEPQKELDTEALAARRELIRQRWVPLDYYGSSPFACLQ